MATQSRDPTGDDAESGTWGGASAGTRYTLVDDHPDNTGADYLTHGTATAGDITFTFSAFTVPSGSTVNSVILYFYDYKAGPPGADTQGRLKVGGSYYQQGSFNPTNATYVLRTITWSNNPHTAAAWTVDDVNGVGTNALQAFGMLSSDANPQLRLPSFQLVVDYTLPTHATTGTLTAGSATLAGTSLHPHTTTGALTAGSATATGSATLTPAAAATVYYVIGPDSGWANPNATEIKAGQLSGGGPATASGSEASPVSTATLTFAAAATGLDSGTSYRIAFVWSDGTDNSNVDVSAPFSTLATHATTGTLSAQAATLAGTSAHEHAATGALSAQAATAAGTAAHYTLHATTGTLTAQAATASGTSAHEHAATGALSAQAATAAGTAAHLTLHTTTGALSSQSATMTGAATLESDAFDATGALSAQASTVAGTAARLALHTTTGVLTGQAATVVGSAVHPHTTTGVLAAQAAELAGTAERAVASGTFTTEGTLAADSAVLAGSAAHLTLHTTTGVLAGQSAVLAGTALHPHTSTGTLAAQSALVTGAAEYTAPDVFDATGALSAQAALVVGAATRYALHTTTGALVAGSATLAGSSAGPGLGLGSTGILAAGSAGISGTAVRLPLLATLGLTQRRSAASGSLRISYRGQPARRGIP